MEPTMYCYTRCGTCQKAKKWLKEQAVEVTEIAIDKTPPSKGELTEWIKQSGLPLKRFFNTSGKIYKDLNLKEKLKTMSEEEQIELLAQNGMLIKRPLVIANSGILVGFKEEEWERTLLKP